MHQDASIHDTSGIIERLEKLFHDDKESYTKFLACRSASAQWLLDLLQDVSLAIFCATGLLTECLPVVILRPQSHHDE
jgi:hypothetical protein